MGLARTPRTLDEDALGLPSDGSDDRLLHLDSNVIGTDAQLVHILLEHLSELEGQDGTPCRHAIPEAAKNLCIPGGIMPAAIAR